MPASSVGAMNSWGVYLIASAALILILAPSLQKISSDARIASDWRSIDGVSRIIDSLKPGMTVHLKLGSESNDAIILRGNEISCHDGTGTILRNSRWPLPAFTLLPGAEYVITLGSTKVEVEMGV
jgi:hypothetical protein